MNVIKLESILDKYIIVVDGDESRIVYYVDDSRIFSIHITGSGRGARNAALSKNTFKTLKKAEKGIQYLDTCHFLYKFRAIKVSELKLLSEKGYNFLMEDIEDYNRDIFFEIEEGKKSKKEDNKKYKKLKNTAIDLVKNGSICSIEYNEDNDTIIILKEK